MIKPAEIKKKSLRKYGAFLKAFLRGESFFPLRIPARMATARTDWSSLRAWQRSLLSASKQAQGYGFTVVLGAPTRTRTHGTQSLPEKIIFERREDYLRYLGKVAEFEQFVKDVELIRAGFPQLQSWLETRPQDVIEQAGQWADLLKVVQYFLQNPNPQLYIRELPVEVHSKFIEQHKDVLRRLLDELLPAEQIQSETSSFEARFGLKRPPLTVRLRLLDPALKGRLQLPFDDFRIPMEELAALPLAGVRVIISENLMPFLTLPSLADGLAIFGEGNAVSSLEAPWLEGTPITYWGDLDQQGFRFLANLRQRYPQVQSLFMDLKTLERYQAFAVVGVADNASDPSGLTPQEAAAYEHVKSQTLRLEQERIAQREVEARLESYD